MYKRVLLKLSGEALSNKDDVLDVNVLKDLAQTIKTINDLGVQLCIVCGGGNIIRGKYASNLNIDRIKADTMGMLGTMINALAIESTLNSVGCKAYVQTALNAPFVADDINPEMAIKKMQEGYVVIFAAGVGKPYYSTDTGASLRATETKCDAILIAKNGVDGVYDSDPRVNKDAKMFTNMTFKDILENNLEVIDSSAAQMCYDNNIDAVIFNMNKLENIIAVVKGEKLGTVITGGK